MGERSEEGDYPLVRGRAAAHGYRGCVLHASGPSVRLAVEERERWEDQADSWTGLLVCTVDEIACREAGLVRTQDSLFNRSALSVPSPRVRQRVKRFWYPTSSTECGIAGRWLRQQSSSLDFAPEHFRQYRRLSVRLTRGSLAHLARASHQDERDVGRGLILCRSPKIRLSCCRDPSRH